MSWHEYPQQADPHRPEEGTPEQESSWTGDCCAGGTESSAWRLWVDCHPAHMDVKLLFISTVIKIYESFMLMCLVEMHTLSTSQCCQHRLTPMHTFRFVSWWLSIVSWTQWQDWNVSNLLQPGKHVGKVLWCFCLFCIVLPLHAVDAAWIWLSWPATCIV